MAYKGGVPVNSGFYPRNDFPIIEAKDIYVSDDQRLNQTIENLQNIIGDAPVSEQIAEAIAEQDHFSGDYNDLKNRPNIVEDESSDLCIADGSGNTIFKVDNNGIHTTALTLNGENIKNILDTYILSIDYDKLLAFDTDEIVINDKIDEDPDNNDTDADSETSAVLGIAVLGQMILG